MARPDGAAPTFFGAYGEWMGTPPPSWEDLAWLREQWGGPFMVKGIMPPRRRPARGRRSAPTAISVSNHGGNNLDGTPASIRACPPSPTRSATRSRSCSTAASAAAPTWSRRWPSAPRAVMIGRAYLWGLAANGEAGVENVLEILRAGIDSTLLGLGRASIAELATRATSSSPTASPWRREHSLAERTWQESRPSARPCWRCRWGRPSSMGRTCRWRPTRRSPSPSPPAPPPSGRSVIVAPALPYGSSGEHAGFPGTISIGQEATELVLVELCRSAAASFGRVLFVCGHGGNVAPVNRAVERLRGEGREVRAWSPRWEGDAHAGRLETSLMLAVAPALVRTDRAAPGNTEPVEELFGDLVARGVRPLAANGVLGDPTDASAEEGRELLAAAVADLVAVVDAWALGRREAA